MPTLDSGIRVRCGCDADADDLFALHSTVVQPMKADDMHGQTLSRQLSLSGLWTVAVIVKLGKSRLL